jgi:hypothetical protein
MSLTAIFFVSTKKNNFKTMRELAYLPDYHLVSNLDISHIIFSPGCIQLRCRIGHCALIKDLAVPTAFPMDVNVDFDVFKKVIETFRQEVTFEHTLLEQPEEMKQQLTLLDELEQHAEIGTYGVGNIPRVLSLKKRYKAFSQWGNLGVGKKMLFVGYRPYPRHENQTEDNEAYIEDIKEFYNFLILDSFILLTKQCHLPGAYGQNIFKSSENYAVNNMNKVRILELLMGLQKYSLDDIRSMLLLDDKEKFSMMLSRVKMYIMDKITFEDVEDDFEDCLAEETVHTLSQKEWLEFEKLADDIDDSDIERQIPEVPDIDYTWSYDITESTASNAESEDVPLRYLSGKRQKRNNFFKDNLELPF